MASFPQVSPLEPWITGLQQTNIRNCGKSGLCHCLYWQKANMKLSTLALPFVLVSHCEFLQCDKHNGNLPVISDRPTLYLTDNAGYFRTTDRRTIPIHTQLSTAIIRDLALRLASECRRVWHRIALLVLTEESEELQRVSFRVKSLK